MEETEGGTDVQSLLRLRNEVASHWSAKGRDGNDIAQAAVLRLLEWRKIGGQVNDLRNFLYVTAKHIVFNEYARYDLRVTPLDEASAEEDSELEDSKPRTVNELLVSDTFDIASARELLLKTSPLMHKYLEEGPEALTTTEQRAICRERLRLRAEWYGMRPGRGTEEPLAESLDKGDGQVKKAPLHLLDEEEVEKVYPIRGKDEFSRAELSELMLKLKGWVKGQERPTPTPSKKTMTAA